MAKQNWIDEPKMPVYPVRWQCLLCWREHQQEKPMSMVEAIRSHRAINQEEIATAQKFQLEVLGDCSGRVILIEEPERIRRTKREPSPELPLEGVIEQT